MPEEKILALDEAAIGNLSEAGCKLLVAWLGEKITAYHNPSTRKPGVALTQAESLQIMNNPDYKRLQDISNMVYDKILPPYEI